MRFSSYKLTSSLVLGFSAVVSACGTGPEERSPDDHEQLAGRSLAWGGTGVTQPGNDPPATSTGRICYATDPLNPFETDPCLIVGSGKVQQVCSASLIGKNIILTAGHCFCEVPPPAGNPVRFFTSPANSVLITKFLVHPLSICSSGLNTPDQHLRDIAVAKLGSVVTTMPILPVYTNSDFIDKFNSNFFQEPLRAAGFGASDIGDPPPELGFRHSASIKKSRIGFFGSIIEGSPDIESQAFPGDSGGPVAISDGQKMAQFGVFSATIDQTGGAFVFAPTFDVGEVNPNNDQDILNGAFIRNSLNEFDADGDGVTDDIDNCPGSKCPQDPSKCSNPGQEDSDSDHVGDACDNCPGSVCASIWSSQSLCNNPDQEDTDGDGVGDVCDICPEVKSSNQEDTDGDRVGDICDSCPIFSNPVDSCTEDSDCKGADGNKHRCIFQIGPTLGRCSFQTKGDIDGDGIGDACDVCPEIKNQGNQADSDGDGVGDVCDTCPKMPNGFIPCFGNNDCTSTDGKPHKCIVKAGGLGRCSVQLDDTDNDGVGDSCDNCASVADATIQTNSNDLAEDREALFSGQAAPPRNDACDPVPVLRSVQVGLPKSGGASLLPLLPGTSGEDDTVFVSSSGLGAGATGFGVPISSVNRTVGFRHCSCYSDNKEASLIDCWQNVCAKDPNQFVLEDNKAALTWRKVTVGRYNTEKKEIKKPILNPTFNLDFTSDVDCNSDAWPHATSSDLCRFGEVSIFRWNHLKDVSRPETGLPRPVQSFNNKQQTTGLFWSHVLKSSGFDSVSPRDATSAGRLRDSYEYTRTPSGIPVQIVGPPGAAIPCQFVGCRLTIRKDWLRDPGLLLPGDNLRYVGRSSVLVAQAGRVLAVQQDKVDAVDVTGSFSDVALANYLSGMTSWLTSTEPGHPGRVAENALQGIGLPRSFTPGVTNLVSVFVNGAGISLGPVRRTDGPSRMFAAVAGAVVQPELNQTRTDAVGVFSGVEQNAYIVGGQVGEQQTGEIWEYGATTQEWRQLFSNSETKPSRVLAVTYDSLSGNLLVLDEQVAKWSSTARLLVFNTHTGDVKKIAAIPRHGVFEKFGLVAQGDDFWLVAGHKKGWKTFAFHLKGDKLIWTGLGSGKGQMLDIPFNSSEGVYLPVTYQGETYLESIQPHTFEPLWGCSEL